MQAAILYRAQELLWCLHVQFMVEDGDSLGAEAGDVQQFDQPFAALLA
jgi:hypothetical protein